MLGPAEVGDILLAQTNSTGAQGWFGRLWCLSPRGAYRLQMRKKKQRKERERKKTTSASSNVRPPSGGLRKSS